MESQTFNDGLCGIYAVTNVAPPGKKPTEKLELKGKLRYAERTVGMNRFTQFMQNSVEISRVIRVPKKIEVSTQDVAIPDCGQPSRQFRVVQVQYPQGVTPGCMDISLARIEEIYAMV